MVDPWEGCAELLLTSASPHDIGCGALTWILGVGKEPGRHSSARDRDEYNRISGRVSQGALRAASGPKKTFSRLSYSEEAVPTWEGHSTKLMFLRPRGGDTER